MKQAILVLIIAVGIIASFSKGEKPSIFTKVPEPTSTSSFPVQYVIDGDTIVIKTPNGEDKVRFIGIDAPETNATNGAVECFGLEATQYLRDTLEKETVTIETDPTQGERDTYGRLLAYVFLDGKNINQALIAGGFAREYTFNLPYRYRDEFKQSQAEAKENKKGIWSPSCNS